MQVYRSTLRRWLQFNTFLTIPVFNRLQLSINIQNRFPSFCFGNYRLVVPLIIFYTVRSLKSTFIPEIEHIVKNLVERYAVCGTIRLPRVAF